MINEMNELIKKIHFFMKEEVVVHVGTKYKTFVNGRIVEIRDGEDIRIGSFAIEDRKLGKMWLLFSEVIKIEKFTEPLNKEVKLKDMALGEEK